MIFMKLINKIKALFTQKESNWSKLLKCYMETMTLPEQRLLRDRNKVSWRKAKPRQSEFQKLVKDYLNKQ